MSDALNKNILATIIYYDGLDYPLTSFEIWKYLIRTDYYAHSGEPFNVSLGEINKRLQDKGLLKYIEFEKGFHYLKGRSYLVKKRISSGKISAGKLKRLRRVVFWLRLVPFVRMIGVTGALAMKNAKMKSDWDLLVVLKYGKIWTGRTLVTLVTHIFKKRRHGSNISDRVCLNFFVTDQSLEVITKDLFSASEYMFLFPLFGWETFLKFQIKNRWIAGMKPSYGLCEISPLKTLPDSKWTRNFRRFGEFIFSAGFIENQLKKIEKKRIMNNPKTHQDGSLVYANDDALVFLPDPHGPKAFEQFKEKIQRLGS